MRIDEHAEYWFLLVRNHDTGETKVRVFDDSLDAVDAYGQAEDEWRHLTRGGAPSVEVVLLMADSLEDLERGYPHYFVQRTRSELRDSLMERLYAQLGPGARVTEVVEYDDHPSAATA